MTDAATSQSTAKPIVPFLAKIYRPLEPLAYPVVRVFAGLMLMPHGAQKLFGSYGGPGFDRASQFMASQFGAPGALWAGLVGGTEFFGGLLIALGLFTRVAGVMAAVLLWVAVFAIHMKNGFFSSNGGYEYAMLWAIVASAIAVRGGGNLSIDKAIGREF